MVEEVINITVQTRAAGSNVDELTKKVDQLEKKSQQTGQTMERTTTRMRNGYSPLKESIDRVTGGLFSLGQNALQAARNATIGMKGMKAAIIGTGVGALIVGIGLGLEMLINLWSKYSDELKNSTAVQEAQLERQLTNQKVYWESVDSARKTANDLELARAKQRGASEAELHAIKMRQMEEEYLATEKQLLAEKDIVAQKLILKRILAEDIKDKNSKEYQEAVALADQLSAEYQKLLNTQQAAKEKFEADKEIAEINYEIAKEGREQARRQKTQAQNDADDAKEKARKEKKYAEDLEAEKKYYEDVADAKIKAIAELESAQLTQYEKDWQAAYDHFAELIILAEQYGEDTTALKQKQSDATKAIELKAIEDVQKANEEANKATMQIARDEAAAKRAIVGNLIEGIALQAEQGSKEQKALAVASATWNTFDAVTAALGAKPYGPWNIAQAVATGLFGLAQVRRIVSTNVQKGGASIGGGFSAPQSQTPTVNIPGQSGINSIVNGFNSNQNPIQAYVVASAVTSGQELNRKKLANATFG